MEEKSKKIKITPISLNFKEFLEKIRDDSGLSTEDFLKYKITLPINDFNTFNMLKNIPDLSLELEKRTVEELKDDTYLRELNKIDPKLITIKTELNEFYAKTNIIQYYKNYSNKPIELILKFPYNSSVQFSKFTLEMNNKKVVSKVLDKEKAEEKYNDAIASGKTGAISSIKDKIIQVNIGNINAGELVKLTTEFIQFLYSEDMSYCYTTIKNFPYFSNRGNTMFKVQTNIIIKTRSKITRIITKGFKQNLEKKFNNDYTQCELDYFTQNFTNKEKCENEFKILFRTLSMNELNLITQYDPKKDETSCILNMLYNKKEINIPLSNIPDLDDKLNYIELYQKNIINSNPSLFIFLVDKSGSMSGPTMEIAKEALIFFLQSLPKNSYYQIIAFSSDFNYIYSKDPCEYTMENVNNTIEELKKIDAYGGTNLLKPLEIVFGSKKYDNINLCRNLFILTDGIVDNSKTCLKYIENNSSNYRVHSFGIGYDYEKDFIKKAGKNGSYNFVNNVSNLKQKVIESLNQALRSYLYDPQIKIENINKLYEFFPKKKVYYQDEVFKYYFIAKNKLEDKINVNLEYYDKTDLIKKDFIFDEKNIIKEEDGDIISKIIIGNILNNNELEINKDIELAKKYQVLSKSTSLYAEVENENANANLSQLEVVEQNELNYMEQKNIDESEGEESSSDKERNKERDSSSSSEREYKRSRKKCKKKIESSSDSESESESSEPKYKKCKKKKKARKKISESSSESEDEEEIKCKRRTHIKRKMKEKSDESSNDGENNFAKKTRRIMKEMKKDRAKPKCKKESCEKSEEQKYCKEEKFIDLEFNDVSEEKKEIYFNYKEMVLTQNIIEGNWYLNPQTENLIKLNQNIYDKIKTYVEKYYQNDDKENVMITILVLYYLNTNKNLVKEEYILIINKGLQYLESKGIKEILYNNIEPYLNQ